MLVPPLDSRLKGLILEKQEEYGDAVIEMEVMPDPVHRLLDVDPRLGIDAVVRKIQGYTAHTIRKEYPGMKSRLPSMWTRARLIATVGAVSLEAVKPYIEEQKGKGSSARHSSTVPTALGTISSGPLPRYWS